MHIQRGRLEAPQFLGGASNMTSILTLQHASGTGAIDQFFFFDWLRDNGPKDGFNESDIYGEYYLHLDLSALGLSNFHWGPITGLGLQFGLNYGADANVLKYLPGLRLRCALPHFSRCGLDLTAYIDGNAGLTSGGAPRESDSWQINWSFASPLEFLPGPWSLEGHIEYIASRRNERGQSVSWWVLAQPQLRLDLGQLLRQKSQRLYIGIEWQTWLNKLGATQTDEHVAQALIVWRF